MALFASPTTIAVERPQVISIGVFDGVHRGHQYLLGQAVMVAARHNAEVLVITFWPPPILILRPETPPMCLMTHAEKTATLSALPGIAHLLTVPFTEEFSRLTAEQFMHTLQARMRVVAFVEGDDFTFGYQRQGTINWLQDYGANHDIEILPVQRRTIDDAPISSTRIRRLVEVGAVDAASVFLGRPYLVGGVVIHGDGRGRLLGYPTANLRIDPLKLLPANGVYAVRAWLAASPAVIWQGVASIGVRPTFDGKDRRVEVFLLDMFGDLYDQELHVAFVQRLRDELRFDSVDALVTQMGADVQLARKILDTETGAL